MSAHKDSSRPRGRPRAYDPDKASDAIMATFWRKGYDATTLDDLCSETGLNRPSLYKFVGSKEKAYLSAIERYLEHHGAVFVSALTAGNSFRADLSTFFEAYIAIVCSDYGPGCPIGCTLPAGTETLPGARHMLADTIGRLDRTVAERVRKAQEAGELSRASTPDETARLIVSTLLSLSLRSRAGESRKQLQGSADAFIRLITENNQRAGR